MRKTVQTPFTSTLPIPRSWANRPGGERSFGMASKLGIAALVVLMAGVARGEPIDRQALVGRHRVRLESPDRLNPLSVGNGEFAFTVDITGLQTFPAFHKKGMPLGTLSQWGWHSFPNPDGYALSGILTDYEVGGRTIPYASDEHGSDGYSAQGQWLRANPHRLHLGRIGLRLLLQDGTEADIDDLKNTRQELDLWTGTITSSFELEGTPVQVETVCDPRVDQVAVRIESPLLNSGAVSLFVAFPYGSGFWGLDADWDQPDRHRTQIREDADGFRWSRELDDDAYFVHLAASDELTLEQEANHKYRLSALGRDELAFVCALSSEPLPGRRPGFESVRRDAAAFWAGFWSSGGAVDFSECTDSRAAELERRVVLSQYLTAIHCAGSRPPQETGLVGNSWHGKFHLEMHWWHAAHFWLWNRCALAERSLAWYQTILPRARATARTQGYDGARWPKMVGPEGRESPSRVGVFLVWQQPHPIYYAELCYRASPTRQTLEHHREIVFQTAEFLASYPTWEEDRRRFVLGPALIPAQESYGSTRAENLNPTFELAYWYWALETALAWRSRLGLEPEPRWDHVKQHLAKPHVRDGVYTGIETPPFTLYRDHPSMVAAWGVVPATPLIDPMTMKQTLAHVLTSWDWPKTWGWDYPMLAMTAARVGEPEKAVDALFLASPKNRFLTNGHNYQSERLPLYLPGNGGLLAAVAMMAAGWDGCPDRPAPGFPDNGQWNVRWEGLTPAP